MADTWSHRYGDMLEVDRLTGWRCEHVAYDLSRGLFGARAFLTSSPTGDWGTAECRRNDHPAPDAGCTCGYRVCRDLGTLIRFNHTLGPTASVGEIKCLLTRVAARGTAACNLETWERYDGLSESNCIAVQQVKPIWPAYTRTPAVAEGLKRTYPYADVRYVKSWAEIDPGER